MRDGKKILTEIGTNEVEFLKVVINGQIFGINVAKVKQVLEFDPGQLCSIPNTPVYLLGNYNYRDTCLPVINLANYFSQKSESLDQKSVLIVLEFNNSIIGAVVQKIERIMRCSWNDFVQPKHQLSVKSKSLVVGTVMINHEMFPIIDVEAILGDILPEASIEALDPDLSKASNILTGLRVVYCEDSQTVRKILLSSLEAAGCRNIKTFFNGADAYDFLSSNEVNYDVIISDIEMPKMDGLTLCKKLQANDRTSQVPIIFFSSMINDQMREKCSAVGGTAAFSKPEITALINNLAERFS